MSKKHVQELAPSEVKEFLIDCLTLRQVGFVGGPGGIGKSEVVAQVAEMANAQLIDVRLSQKLPEEISGVPEKLACGTKVGYLPFDTFPMEGDTLPAGKSGWIIFFDELTSASDEVWAAMYEVLLDHSIGGKKLHPKCLVLAAGNRGSDSAIARPLPDTLITRMNIVNMRTSVKDWLAWANALPEEKKNDQLIAFIQKHPDNLISTQPSKDRKENEPYNAPRGWAKVMQQANLHEKQAKNQKLTDKAGMPIGGAGGALPISDRIFRLMAAAVGLIPARAFREEYDQALVLPQPWDIAQAPASAPIPKAHVGAAKVAVSNADHFIKSPEQTRDNLLIYMNRMDAEYRSLFIENIKEALGSTIADLNLIEDISNRLGAGGGSASNMF